MRIHVGGDSLEKREETGLSSLFSRLLTGTGRQSLERPPRRGPRSAERLGSAEPFAAAIHVPPPFERKPLAPRSSARSTLLRSSRARSRNPRRRADGADADLRAREKPGGAGGSRRERAEEEEGAPRREERVQEEGEMREYGENLSAIKIRIALETSSGFPLAASPRSEGRAVGVPFRDLRRFNRTINLTPCCNNASAARTTAVRRAAKEKLGPGRFVKGKGREGKAQRGVG
ncbi:hypothetical protein KM043_000924 [Ampulex compressa]|nr:hypothetical protein KM043_000924 [Ampulex compressa]